MESSAVLIDLRAQPISTRILQKKLLGIETIARLLLSFNDIGIKNFHIITDYKLEELKTLKSTLEQYATRYRMKIKFYRHSGEADGEKVINRILEKLPQKVVLVRGCIIFSKSALEKIREALLHKEDWIRVVENSKSTIGGLKNGVYIINKNELVKLYSNDFNYVKSTQLDNISIINIDSKKSLKKAEKLLLSELAKPEDGFISYHINRKISTRISKVLVNTNVSSNTITLISFSILVIAAYLFSTGSYLNTLIAGILTQFSSIIDGCDGELARLRYKPSPYGGLLDTILDRYGDILITIGIFYGYANSFNGSNLSTIWLLSFIPITGFLLGSYARKEYELKFGHKPRNSTSLKLIRRDLRLFTIFIGSLINHALEATLLIGSLTHFITVWKFLIEPRNHKRYDKK
ncbi:MAG: CDP-alcohol phosphatidyltransferase family protein [Candidatus Njordarchaeia archaeon]